MADVKYRIRHFNPTANQSGGHSVYAEAVVDNVITNKELAKKIHSKGSISSPAEIKAILEVAAEVILEETQENNRIQLETGDGGNLVSIYPKAEGSVSDKDVLAHPEQYGGATVATEEMLTADKVKWSLGASVGRKFSQQFSLQKSARRVDYNPSQQAADPDAEQGGTQQGGTTNNPPAGGENEDGE